VAKVLKTFVRNRIICLTQQEDTYDYFIYQLVDEHEISAEVVFFEAAAEVVNAADNLSE